MRLCRGLDVDVWETNAPQFCNIFFVNDFPIGLAMGLVEKRVLNGRSAQG
tara:strand:+ start:399 stop:548 length:150 start_codon:yes stop_codon:yes gene_type:complete